MTQSNDNRIVANVVSGSTPIHSTVQSKVKPMQSTLGIVPSATTERKGIIRIAKQDEALEGTDNSLAITPLTLKDFVEHNALPIDTMYGKKIEMSIDKDTYVLTVSLKDQNGEVLNSASVDGLQSEITEENPLNADLVEDSTSINKFVTTSEKEIWNNKVSDVQGEGTIDVSRLDNVATIRSTTFVFEQAVSSATWVILHNLNKMPSVFAVDTTGKAQLPNEIIYDNENQVTVQFISEFAGKAYLN